MDRLKKLIGLLTLPGGAIVKNDIAYLITSDNVITVCDYGTCSRPEVFNYVYQTYKQNKYGAWVESGKVGREERVK